MSIYSQLKHHYAGLVHCPEHCKHVKKSDFSPRVLDERINEGGLIEQWQIFGGKEEELQFANRNSDSFHLTMTLRRIPTIETYGRPKVASNQIVFCLENE